MLLGNTNPGRDLMCSRILEKPLAIMQAKVDTLLGKQAKQVTGQRENDLKYAIFSAHDTQVDNMLVFLTQNKEGFDYVPYAAQINFELKYSPECLSSGSPSEYCFSVGILSNGEPLHLPGCSEVDCSYDEFRLYIS